MAVQSNRTVLLGGAIIVSVGFVKAVTSGGNPAKVVAGGIGVVLLASLIELFGPRANQVASGLVGVATLTVLLVELPAVYAAITNAQKNTGTAKATTTTAKPYVSGQGHQ